MKRILRMLAAAGPFAVALVAGPPAAAQKHRRRCTARDNQPRGKSGGILRVPWFDSPPSLSLLEESTVSTNRF